MPAKEAPVISLGPKRHLLATDVATANAATRKAATELAAANATNPEGRPGRAGHLAGARAAGGNGRNRNKTTEKWGKPLPPIGQVPVAASITTLTFDRNRDLLTLNLADQQGAPFAEIQLTTAAAKDLRRHARGFDLARGW